MGLECRCPHHAHTQELLRAGPKKPDAKGGIRRKLKNRITETIQSLPVPIDLEVVPTEVQNTCPKCGAKQRATDVYCRVDGTRLAMGKQCLGCGAPQEPDDLHCWQCGLKAGEKPEIVEAIAQMVTEDRVVALVREAKLKGISNPTINKLEQSLQMRETVVR